MKPMANGVPVSMLHEMFTFDSESGALYWKARPQSHFANKGAMTVWNSKFPGRAAGNADYRGAIHVAIQFGGRQHKPHAHRIVWAMHFGEWPQKTIDHIDCNPSNNRISNLRLASHSENIANMRKRVDNKSGFKGVWEHAPGRWRSAVRKNGKPIYLGVFKTPEEAHAAYATAAAKIHGQFARA